MGEELRRFSALVYALNSGLFDEGRLQDFRKEVLGQFGADCFCFYHFHADRKIPAAILRAGCRLAKGKRLESWLRGIAVPADGKPGRLLVVTDSEAPGLKPEACAKFLREVHQSYWDHAAPGYYLFGLVPLKRGCGLMAWRRQFRNRFAFGESEKQLARELCLHLESYFRLRYLCSLWREEGGVRSYFLSKGLSKREVEVAFHLLRGAGLKDIARRLQIKEHTVKDHLKGIYHKLGVHSQIEFAATFIRLWEGALRCSLNMVPFLDPTPSSDQDS